MGLASYGEMSIPFGVDSSKRSIHAREFLVALSGNYEYRFLSIILGGYVRYFRDADPNLYDFEDRWEYIIVLRPYLFWLKYFGSAIEFSFEESIPFGLLPGSDKRGRPYIFSFSIFPLILTPYGPGTYIRPHIRVIYRIAYLSSDFRESLPREDPYRGRSIEHFLGIQAEWWFNSSYR